MALDKKFIGKKYGPTTYEVGVEKLREFAYAISGGVPSHGWGGHAPDGLLPALYDAKTPGGVVGFPGFAVTFSIAPFHEAVTDPAIGINLLMLVHGEQEFEFEESIKPGDVMTTTGEIVEIYEKANMDFFVVTTESKNQHGKVAVKGRWMAVIRR
jgi:hypothetical protein